MKIEGKVAIVTGGSGGLGEATARALVAAGAKVAIWDLKEEMGLAVAESLGAENAYYSNINVTEEADGLRTLKCSDATVEAWNKINPDLRKRAISPSGIRLDFHTDSEEITFSLKGSKFDLLVDGLLADRFFGSEECEDFSVTLDGDSHRITLIFPSHDCTYCRVAGLELTDGAKPLIEEVEKLLFYKRL